MARRARPLGRLIQESIKKPLAEELLFGNLTLGGTVHVELSKDKLKPSVITLNKEQFQEAKIFLETLEYHDDVQKVYSNLEMLE